MKLLEFIERLPLLKHLQADDKSRKGSNRSLYELPLSCWAAVFVNVCKPTTTRCLFHARQFMAKVTGYLQKLVTYISLYFYIFDIFSEIKYFQILKKNMYLVLYFFDFLM